MMFKWIGAALIMMACGGCGMAMAANYRREEQCLRQLLRALERIRNELSCRRSPLPMLFRQVALQSENVLQAIWEELAAELEQQIAPDAGCCMAVVLSRHGELPAKCRALMEDLGRSLGQFDLDGQMKELDSVHAECDRILQEHCADRSGRIRCYQTLGVCAGGALAVLLL